MIKKKVNTELGRSMVEMLGTLAIMGVLTIGGIAGYRYAINKSNANTILNAVSQMAVTASTELTTQGSLTLPEWKDTNGNLSISGAFGVTTAQNNDGTFSIIVSDMNDEVCERIKGMDWKVPKDVAINGESDSCDQGEANAITFVFSNTLTKKSVTDGSDEDAGATCDPVCTGDTTCQNGVCLCNDGRLACNNEQGICCDKGFICSSNISGNCQMVNGCSSNTECSSDSCSSGKCLCNIRGSSSTPSNGFCDDIGDYYIVNDQDSPFNGWISQKSGHELTYWGSENWCLYFGKQIPSLIDFGINKANYTNYTFCASETENSNIAYFLNKNFGSEGNYRRVKDNKNAAYSYFIGVGHPSCNEVNTRVYANPFQTFCKK